MTALPLAGIRVLDLSRHFPGPYVTGALVDLGATVTKIEEREVGDPVRFTTPPIPDGSDSALHAWLNRGKKSVALDLKLKDAQAIVKTLARKSDILVETFRPGVMRRLGLDYASLRRSSPHLLYVSLSGFGAKGPMSRRAMHDLNAVGQVGLLSGGASMSPGLLADTASGLLTLIAILAKLGGPGVRARKGGLIDLSILDGALSLASAPLARSLCAPGVEHDELWGTHACYRVYECADQRSLTVGALEPQFWSAICEAMGFPAHARAQWSKSRQSAMCADFEGAFKTKTQAEWMKILGPLDACVMPVQTMAEVLKDTQIRARHAWAPQASQRGHFESPTFLPQVTGGRRRRRAPRHGEHTRSVLLALGYSKTRIERLLDTGVIR